MCNITFYDSVMHEGKRAKVFEIYKGIPRKAIREDGKVVRYFQTKKPELLVGNITDKGYRNIIYRENSPERPHRKVTIHRLVATAFIDNPENKQTIDHINEDKQDNRIENLRWCSAEENIGYYNEIKKSREYLVLKDVLNKTIAEKKELKKECNKLHTEHAKLKKEYKKLERLKECIETKLKKAELLTEYEKKESTGIGNTVYVNGIKCKSVREASRVILKSMPYKNVETVRKEIQKITTGRRPEGMMYGKFNITLTDPNS